MLKKTNYQGKNSEIIQQQNRLLVLRLIREKKVVSRVGLSELTGLKQATITNIINELMEREYVEETGLIEGTNGRRVKGIALNSEKVRVLVSRITSDYYAVGIYDLQGTCIKVAKKFWEQGEGFLRKLEFIRDDLREYMSLYGENKQVIGTGIAIEGSVTSMDPEFKEWQDRDMETYLSQYFSEELGMAVFVENMSNMSAFFEWNRQISNGVELQTLVCLSIGYAVDCTVVFDGRFLKGRNGKAGHFGHVSIDMNGPLCECGNRGCIRNYISVGALKKRYAELLKSDAPEKAEQDWNIRDIVQAYYDQEKTAVMLYEEVAEKLGVIFANLINQFHPEELIFGDEIPNNDTFLELVKSYTKKRLPKHRYERTNLMVFREKRKTENDVGMRGMCLFVINEKLKDMKLN